MNSIRTWLCLLAFLILITTNVCQGDNRQAKKSESSSPRVQPAPGQADAAGDLKQPRGLSGEDATHKKGPSSETVETTPKAKYDKPNIPRSKNDDNNVVDEEKKSADASEQGKRKFVDSDHGKGPEGILRGDGFDFSADERLKMYQKVFMEKRQRHLSAVEDMMTSYDYEQQFKLVNMVFEKMQEMYSQSRKTLTEHGFEPGAPFPGGDVKEELLEAISVLLENVAFLGDIVLRLPDISSIVYNKNRPFRDLAKWAIKFVNDSNFFDDVHKQLLHLLSQELKIIKREPDFVNPFRREAEPVDFDLAGNHNKKKPKPPKRRGPRMSKQEL